MTEGEEKGERKRPEAADGKVPVRRVLARAGFLEYDRVLFFSDAVFAIAITLLAVNLHVPDTGHVHAAHELSSGHTISAIVGFGISFVVIALFWIGHHGIFRYIVALDRHLIGLNLLFLGTIAFLPYPTDLLSETNSDRAAVIFYAACGAAAGLTEMCVWLYATYSNAGLASDSAKSVRTFYLLRTLRIPVVFLLSIPIALISARWGSLTWILIWISGALISRFYRPPDDDPPEQTD
ncbi:MAG TPA: TMEM175 family protein [Streptosporangiaceae bacterium]|nr:TMEM175 family protein [Streptosporangiaceae bacterium]